MGLVLPQKKGKRPRAAAWISFKSYMKNQPKLAFIHHRRMVCAIILRRVFTSRRIQFLSSTFTAV